MKPSLTTSNGRSSLSSLNSHMLYLHHFDVIYYTLTNIIDMYVDIFVLLSPFILEPPHARIMSYSEKVLKEPGLGVRRPES